MSGYYPYFSKWLASQFQIIKDRNLKDVFSDKPIWSKIYPQQEGIPVYNKSGRYWVKLYHQGKERKIEIDDRMPTSVKNHCLFPRTVKKEEIWPMLFAKALMKLGSQVSLGETEQEFGDGSILYALTGLIPESMHVEKMILPEDWKYVNELMRDYHYTNGTAFMTCFSSSFYKPAAPSNKLISDKEAIFQAFTNEKRLNPEEDPESEEQKIEKINALTKEPSNTNKGFKRTSPNRKNMTFIEPSLHITTSKAFIEKEKPNYVIPGFAYSILEAFFTEGFNMVFVQKHSEKEVQLIQEYLRLTSINIHKKEKEKEEKVEIRRKRKELYSKIKDNAEKRKSLIEKAPILYRFFRVKTAIARVPVLNIMTPFSPEEIFLAKKCVLNRLKAPPNYDLPDIKMNADDKSVYSQQVSSNGGDTTQIIKPLEDFSVLPNIKDPMKRSVGGTWISDKDFSFLFEYLQVFYNPCKLGNQKHIFVEKSEFQELVGAGEAEVLVIEEEKEAILNEKALFTGNSMPFILGFSPLQAEKGIITPNPYCILQKFDFQAFETVKNYKTLKDRLDCLHLLLENKNHVFRILVNSPLGFSLWLASSYNFKLMSIADYLIKYEAFSNKAFICEYPPLETERSHLFLKWRISGVPDKETVMLIRIKTASEPYLNRFLRYKLIEIKENKEDRHLEGVFYPKEEQIQEVLDYNRFILAPGTCYSLLLESRAPFSFIEGTLEVEFLYKAGLNIDLVENLEPFEFSDRYLPNKYGVLFRERVFFPDDTQASFFLRLAWMVIKEGGVVKEVKGGKKGIIEPDMVEIELVDKRLIYFELFEEDVLIYKSQGVNFVSISNALLKSSKEKQYFLQARLELREWPLCSVLNEETKGLYWVVKSFSTDTIAFIRDTTKEDIEKAIKKEWEDKELGRSEKAKKSRNKYLLSLKKEEGIPLTEAENELLNEPRMSKKQKEEEALKQSLQKGKSPMKVDKKPAQQTGKKKEEPVLVEEKKEKPVPELGNHTMKEIREFLEILTSPKVIEERPKHSGLINVRSPENYNELKEGFLAAKEDASSMKERNMESLRSLKALQGDIKKAFLLDTETRKKTLIESLTNLLKEREDLRKILNIKREKERLLLEACLNEKASVEELERLLNEREIDENLINVGKKVLINARINGVSEKLSLAITSFDLQGIILGLEEIGKWNMGVDEELVEKAQEIVEEAKNNPNYILEKQAELKKNVKKPTGKK